MHLEETWWSLAWSLSLQGNFWERLTFLHSATETGSTFHLHFDIKTKSFWKLALFFIFLVFLVESSMAPFLHLISVPVAPVSWNVWACCSAGLGVLEAARRLSISGGSGDQRRVSGGGQERAWAACLWQSWASWCHPFTREKAKKERKAKRCSGEARDFTSLDVKTNSVLTFTKQLAETASL